MIHDLKCWPEYFQAVKSGIKPFELRKDDRGYAVGDILHLREYDPDTAMYTGDEIDKTVTYVLPTKLFGAIGEGAKYVIMGLAPRDWTPCAEGLPDTNDDVHITYEYRGKLIAAVGFMGHSGAWYILEDDDGNEAKVNAIAWQPLPVPYRAEDTTGKVDHIVDANKKVHELKNPEQCTFRVRSVKYGHGDTERGDDWCNGYQKSEVDDEPCLTCQACKLCAANDPEED